MFKKLKYIPMVMVPMVATVMIAMAAYTINDRRIDYDVDLGDTVVPSFTKITVPFDQRHKDATSLPFTASAAIDIDGDGTEELFIGGGFQQKTECFALKMMPL